MISILISLPLVQMLIKIVMLKQLIGAVVEPTMIIITELMRGGTLQKYLWSIRPRTIDPKLSINFALDIARVMEYLHANGIIHRDLKPSNLIYHPSSFDSFELMHFPFCPRNRIPFSH